MSENTISGKTTPPPRKIRGDARLAQLNPEQRELLRVWLEDENRPYSTVVSLLRQSFGLHTSKSAVAMYYQRHLLPERHEDHNEGAAVFAALSSGEFDAVTITHAKALAWDALARPFPQIDAAARFLDLAHRAEKQELARERLALEKQRVALRAQELASRPPSHPRAESSARRTSTPRPSRPTPPQTSSPQPADQPPPAPAPQSFSTHAPTPAPTLHPLDPNPVPLSTPSSASPTSPEISPNPPLFPASSSIVQPPSPASQPTVTPPAPPLAATPKPAPARPTGGGWPHPDNPGRIRWP